MATFSLTVPLGSELTSGPVFSTLDTSTSMASSSDDVRIVFGGSLPRDEAAEALERAKLKVLQSPTWPVS